MKMEEPGKPKKKEWEPTSQRPQLQEELWIEDRGVPPPNFNKKDPTPEMGEGVVITPKDINRDDSGEDYSGSI